MNGNVLIMASFLYVRIDCCVWHFVTRQGYTALVPRLFRLARTLGETTPKVWYMKTGYTEFPRSRGFAE